MILYDKFIIQQKQPDWQTLSIFFHLFYVEKSKNILIAMLEELLKKEAVADKKKILSEEYGIVMRDDTERRLNTMCNLSEVVLEKGIEKGIEKGMRQLIQQMRNNGKNTKEIAEFCGIPMERVEEMYNTINEI